MKLAATLAVVLACATGTWAQGTIGGLYILSPTPEPATPGEAAARALGTGTLGGQMLQPNADGTLVLPGDARALWWHCETAPLPAVMQTAAVRQALLAWIEAGHGLFLSGTALSYVTVLGIEPAGPRVSGTGGQDTVEAGVQPSAAPRHPVYEGFDGQAPILLVSGGYPAFSDFHGSGGPQGGSAIGDAYPDAGEHPFDEWAYGAGRVIALGWRLPYYGSPANTHRDNLEHLTANVLRYLAKGEWFGQPADSRFRTAQARLERISADGFRLAIEDLTRTFGDRYPHGEEYLAYLDRLPTVMAALDKGDPAALDEARRLADTLDAALLANPLLDFGRLLVIRRSEANLGLPNNWESNSSLPTTGWDDELEVLSPVRPDGELRTSFRPGNGEFVGDVDLDFDASRLLFSMPGSSGRWRIFELWADGTGLTELPLINEPDVDNYDACYLPDGNVIFTSTAPFVGVPCVTGSSHVTNLYRWDRDTGRIRQLTFEQDHDWCPTVLNDGRILYLRWEYSDLPHFVARILFSMAPDGTEQMAYYGSNSYWPNSMFYARPVPNDPSKFVAVVVGHHDNPRMGELVLFDTDQGRHEADGVVQRLPGRGKPVEPIILDGLTGGSWPKYLHPFPLSDKYFLVACKPTPASRWGIYLADVFDNLTLIKEVEGYALLEPVPLQPRTRPPVIAPKVNLERKDAVVYLSDIYAGDGLRGVPRGTVKQLRLLTYQFAYHGMGGQVNRVGLDGPWDVKRIMGTVPVEPDGSALFRVPANTPISLQPLDERGQALQLMRSWMTAMPGETVSCVGCHEPQRTAPATALLTAGATRDPAEITPWYGPTRGFSFNREVQPVLDRYCITCHDGRSAPSGGEMADFTQRPPVPVTGNTDGGYSNGSLFPPAYLALRQYVRGPTIESDMHLLMPGEFCADTTWLVQLLRKGHYGVELNAEAWDRLITWMDLNTPAHGTWHEIVGEEKVNHQRDRRREMMRRYAGRDEDPEAIVETPPFGGAAEACSAALDGNAPAPSAAGWPFGAEEAARRQDAAGTPVRTLDLGDGAAMELRYIPAGEFVEGDPGGLADERPCAAVKIEKPFWMGTCEVTNDQFHRFDAAHDSRLETGDFLQFSVQERGYPVNGPTQPVARVSWREAMAFCGWLAQRTGGRVTLPTESQWEYACRAGSETPLWFGGTDTDFAPYANLADHRLRFVDTFAPWGLPSGAIPPWRPAADSVDDGYRVSAPVGTYQPNAWGLRDMAGNVGEWTRSVYRPYPYVEDAAGAADDNAPRTVRGGSWYDPPHRARSASRRAYPPYRGVFDVGFRAVVEAGA